MVDPSHELWTDLAGPAATDGSGYSNGAGNNVPGLEDATVWVDGAAFGSECVKLSGSSDYKLSPSDCSGDSYYICAKPGKTSHQKLELYYLGFFYSLY